MPVTTHSKDKAPWLLAPCVLLALSGMTVLAPRRAALAAPTQATGAAQKPAAAAYDDGDGDELLEHWGDPKYAREERLQMAGMAGGLALLGVLAARKRRAARGRMRGTDDGR
jgi:hypothetical protein